MDILTIVLCWTLPPIAVFLFAIHKVLLEIRGELRLKNFRDEMKLTMKHLKRLDTFPKE